MVRNTSLSVHIFIPTLKIELISWQVDLVRIDLVTPSHSRVGKSVDNEAPCNPVSHLSVSSRASISGWGHLYRLLTILYVEE